MRGLFSLFDLLSLFYAFRSLQLAIEVWRNRREIATEPLTPQKQRWADNAAFFLAVPPGVLVHELAHALATWWTGGEVVDWGYRLFWGFVQPRGSFTTSQLWLIAAAGTMGSLLYGAALWLWLRQNPHSSLRYFGRRAARFQIFFALLYYPIFTLLGFMGDWRTIYDFSATPVLSGLTALFHLGLLLAYWRWQQRGYFEMPAFPSVAAREAFEQAELVAMDSRDPQAQLWLVDAYRLGGAVNKARYLLQQVLRQFPQSGEAHLHLALLHYGRRGRLTSKARKALLRAVDLGLSRPTEIGVAQLLLAHYYVDIEQYDKALRACEQGVAAMAPGGKYLAQLYEVSATANRRLGRELAAEQDLARATAIKQLQEAEAKEGR